MAGMKGGRNAIENEGLPPKSHPFSLNITFLLKIYLWQWFIAITL